MRPMIFTLFICLIMSFVTSGAVAADKAADNKTYIDPAEAAKTFDYVTQGEYVGEFGKGNGKKQKVGAQVIALGGGKFRVVLYEGGLPGAGAKMKTKVGLDGKRDGDTVQFGDDQGKGAIKDGVISAKSNGNAFSLKKVDRKSETLGAKPPKGAVVLFDGTKDSMKNWKKGSKITAEGLLEQGTQTLAGFGDCKLHLEFRLPFKPYARGQGRGNSGMYVQSRYEVQVLDSFALEGRNNECGVVYSVKAPDVNMCYPPLVWQTYDVEFTAAKFDSDGKKTSNAKLTVRHNGVLIHDNIDVPKRTTASPLKEGASDGPLYLQNHGNPVRFRNIWLVPKK